MKTPVLGVILAAVLAAQNPLARPDPFVGVFQGDQVTLQLAGSAGQYTGTLTAQGASFATNVRAAGTNANGAFAVNGQTYTFTVTQVGTGFVLASEGAQYRLERKGATPPAPSSAP